MGGTRRGGPKACHGPQSCRAGTAETQPQNLALEVAGSSVPRTRRFAPRLVSWSLDRKRAAPDRCHEGSWGDSELRERQPYGPTAPGASAPAGVGSRLTRAPAAASLRPGPRPTLPKAGGVQGRPRRPPPNRGPARPWANATPAPAGESLKEPPDGVTYPGGGGVPGGRAGWGHLARPARTRGLEAFASLLHSLKLNQLQVAEQSAHGGEIPNRPLRPAPGSA